MVPHKCLLVLGCRNYFQLNPMVEEDALKMVILHLEEEASVKQSALGHEIHIK